MSKEQERAELHRTIWQIANDLRGSVDGWDFKQYVLGMLFYRFISENLTNYINANEPEQDFDYAKLSDSNAEFVRGGNKNKLGDENRQNILTAFKNRQDSEHFAKLVDNQKIGENDYNIAVSSYVEQEDTREVIDITQLNAEISQIVARQSELRTAIDEIVADLSAVPAQVDIEEA